MPAPYSYAVTIASGNSSTVSVPFPYLQQSHVTVKVGAVLLAPSSYTWSSPSTIQLGSPPAAGTTVRVSRVTPADNLVSFFTGPSALPHGDLNAVLLQLLYIAQEAYDSALATGDLAIDLLSILDQILLIQSDINAKYAEIVAIWQALQAILNDSIFWKEHAFHVPFAVPYGGDVYAQAIVDPCVLVGNCQRWVGHRLGQPPAQDVVATVYHSDAIDAALTAVATITWASAGAVTIARSNGTADFEMSPGDVIYVSVPPAPQLFTGFGATISLRMT